MTMQPPEADALAQGLAELGLELSPHQAEQLRSYLALISKWNRIYNLTAVRDPASMLSLHLLDSLAVVASLRRALPMGVTPRVLDVGSGAGLPGVVLAVTEPAISVTCVDTVGKKASFIRQVAVELGLRNLQAEHARIEQLACVQADIVTSRAFASLVDFTTLTRHHLKPGAVWMAMKGKRPIDELSALPSDIDVFHVEPIHVPGLHAERCLVWMRPRVMG